LRDDPSYDREALHDDAAVFLDRHDFCHGRRQVDVPCRARRAGAREGADREEPADRDRGRGQEADQAPAVPPDVPPHEPVPVRVDPAPHATALPPAFGLRTNAAALGTYSREAEFSTGALELATKAHRVTIGVHTGNETPFGGASRERGMPT